MFSVLTSESQISEARQTMLRRGASAVDNPLRRFRRKIGLASSVRVGDELKSWDVLTTLEFIENALPKQAAILDIGSYASGVPVSLARLGFSRVAAIDLNPDLRHMPYQHKIRYEVDVYKRQVNSRWCRRWPSAASTCPSDTMRSSTPNQASNLLWT